jgi:hypothetical protein
VGRAGVASHAGKGHHPAERRTSNNATNHHHIEANIPRIVLITSELKLKQGCELNSKAKSISLVSDSAQVATPGTHPSRA